jgi:uncharacterized membrane protein
MTDEHTRDRKPDDSAKADAGSLSEHIDQNVETIAALQRRDRETTSAPRRLVERISRFIGRPAYLLGLLVFVVGWIAINVVKPVGIAPFDPPPFEMLDGILTFSALVTATIVLIAQHRQTKQERQHRHLDLQVSLLTEQKVTKLIHLVEELRRDLPMVKNRDDPQATALQETADTAAVISAMDAVGLTNEAEQAVVDRLDAKKRTEAKKR